MARKRKRSSEALSGAQHPNKRLASNQNKHPPHNLSSLPSVDHPVLNVYFPEVITLRDYLKKTLPARKIGALEQCHDAELAELLDHAVVGYHPNDTTPAEMKQDIAEATQQSGKPELSQSEIVDLVLQIVFKQAQRGPTITIGSRTRPTRLYEDNAKDPNHILAFGSRSASQRKSFPFVPGALGVQITQHHPNSQANTLRRPVWTKLLQKIGVESMINLLLQHCIFLPLGEGYKHNYYQLSGAPISYRTNSPPEIWNETKNRCCGTQVKRTLSCPNSKNGGRKISVQPKASHQNSSTCLAKTPSTDGLSPASVEFLRRRIFHAKPAYNKHGAVKFGLRHNHALNRFLHPIRETQQLLMYIFPREYGLRNAFSPEIPRKYQSGPEKDYTVRDDEIERLEMKYKGQGVPIPKRLQTKALDLVRSLQRRHNNCSYHALLKYCCPQALCDPGVPDKRAILRPRAELPQLPAPLSSPLMTQANVPSSSAINTGLNPVTTSVITIQEREILGKPCFTDFASSSAEVCAFVRAVISKVIPNDFFGTGVSNKTTVLKAVDVFIRMQRRETMTVHDVLQGIKLTDIDWLRPPSISGTAKMSKTDEAKRHKLLAEFIYWLFDSFIIQLLRAQFYITESSAESNRVFYFRHDVWKKISEPQLEKLKLDMFQMVPNTRKKQVINAALDITQFRLTPKEHGVRIIMNLGKKKLKGSKGFKFPESINDTLRPINYVLNYEKTRNPQRIGSSMFNSDEIYSRLKSYQNTLRSNNWTGQPLYFVKVDIQSCFDTIPQLAILNHIDDTMQHEEYRIFRHDEMRPRKSNVPSGKQDKWVKPFIKIQHKAREEDDHTTFEERMKEERTLRNWLVMVDGVTGKLRAKDNLLALLNKHISNNLVKIGKKYYTQKRGIPQGSTISTMLCNLFYGDLENKHLDFLINDPRSLLARMTDDFLLITLDREKAQEFLQIMHDGIPEYGATVNPDKTLVNFETSVNRKKIPRLVESLEFPYCGMWIHTRTLEVRRQRDRKAKNVVGDTITVKYSRSPGYALIKSVANAFKARLHPALFDTSFNRPETVVKNIYHRFIETAMKFHCHVKALARLKSNISVNVLRETIRNICGDVFRFLKSRLKLIEGFECEVVEEGFIRWLGLHAFRKVLVRKQSRYSSSGLLKWLEGEEQRARKASRKRIGVRGLSLKPFESWKY